MSADSSSTVPRIEDLSKILKGHLPAGWKAVLFGSRARDGARARSDWDIGLVGPGPMPSETAARIREALDDLPTLHTIDLVDLTIVPEEFRIRALSGAVELT